MKNTVFNLVVIVAALGYFVDVFDLVLFGMVRIPSLKSIGITNKSELESIGLMLDNYQMAGMLIGGIIWGIIGDKRGRLAVLFGSIIVYSLANIANGMVQTVPMYAFFRLLAGFGLAGELGAGVTLVSEVLDKEKRGLGTTLVASVGVLGAVVGALVVKEIDDWRLSYYIGGAMGLALLLLRVSVTESDIFRQTKSENIVRGNFFMLLTDRKKLIKYLSIIVIAMPIWYLIQMYAKYAPELATAIGLKLVKDASVAINAIMYIYLGLTIGDLCSGLLSNYLKSRKKTLFIFLSLIFFSIGTFWLIGAKSAFLFYSCIFCLGFSAGYWAMFMAVAAESFGTNIRSTVASSAPNIVRGSVILMNLFYSYLKNCLAFDTVSANLTLGVIVMSLAFIAYTQIEETFGKDLNYNEI